MQAQFGDKPFSPLQDMFVDFLAPRMVPDLLDIARMWLPDTIIRDPLEFGGCIAAEVLAINPCLVRQHYLKSLDHH